MNTNRRKAITRQNESLGFVGGCLQSDSICLSIFKSKAIWPRSITSPHNIHWPPTLRVRAAKGIDVISTPRDLLEGLHLCVQQPVKTITGSSNGASFARIIESTFENYDRTLTQKQKWQNFQSSLPGKDRQNYFSNMDGDEVLKFYLKYENAKGCAYIALDMNEIFRKAKLWLISSRTNCPNGYYMSRFFLERNFGRDLYCCHYSLNET